MELRISVFLLNQQTHLDTHTCPSSRKYYYHWRPLGDLSETHQRPTYLIRDLDKRSVSSNSLMVDCSCLIAASSSSCFTCIDRSTCNTVCILQYGLFCIMCWLDLCMCLSVCLCLCVFVLLLT